MPTKKTSSASAPAKKSAPTKPAKKAAAKSAVKAPAKKSAAKKPISPANGSADLVDEQLERYRSMRDFKVTDEPSGAGQAAKAAAAARTAPKRAKAAGGLPFVIQKHAASHLHYDFRLGWAGVLKSWAVAKGPSFYPGDRRLAVQVEDHPMEYGGFEGIIPKGEYGGGTVMVWDQGTWWPQPGHENVEAGLRAGSLKFEMHGTKMKGKWTLVRMGPRSSSSSGSRWGSSSKPNWLLIKEHDEFERRPDDPPITETETRSAVTGRSMEQIAAHEDHVWNSKETAGTGRAWYRQQAKDAPGATPAASSRPKAPGAAVKRPANPAAKSARSTGSAGAHFSSPVLARIPRESQPDFIPPQLALEATTPPEGANWLHELKLDGYRIQARKAGNKVALLTRKGLDWTHRMKPVADAVAALPIDKCTLDGEVCVVAADGTTSFADLQAWFQNGDPARLTYFAFDLLHLDGHDPRNLPLKERKELLESLISPSAGDNIQYSQHVEGRGLDLFHKACAAHAEGIISKQADCPYVGKRSTSWLKSKCLREQEFVIAGFTDSTEGPDRIGSLILAVYDEDPRRGGKLIYTGRTGTGFTQKLKRDLRKQLETIEIKTSPIASTPSDMRRGAHWVTPKFVAQVRFATWTADNLVRQAAFLGLREDKPAAEVRRENPTVAPQPKAERSSTLQSRPAGSAAGRPAATHLSPTTGAPFSLNRKTHLPPDAEVRPLPPASDAKFAVVPRTRTAASTAAAKAEAAALAKSRTAPSSAKPKGARAATPYNIRLTHPEKVLDPQSGLSKGDLAAYYATVAERMLPHIADRPLSLVRCPEGAGKPCFFQKHVNHMLPPGIGSVMVKDKKSTEPEPYITLNTVEALVGLAQMGVLEVHPWGSKNDDLEHPDRLIFDLDPDESLAWSTLTAAAAEVRQRLKKVGLTSFLKTTGGKGLHIVAPIQPRLAWPEIKDFAHRFVLAMERANPALYLTRMTKAARVGKIYLDYLRNERGATAVAPYSPRARFGVHVSLPLPWNALELPKRPVFAARDVDAWRDRLRADPWKAMLTTEQDLDPTRLKP